jgi:hypothetical protein
VSRLRVESTTELTVCVLSGKRCLSSACPHSSLFDRVWCICVAAFIALSLGSYQTKLASVWGLLSIHRYTIRIIIIMTSRKERRFSPDPQIFAGRCATRTARLHSDWAGQGRLACTDWPTEASEHPAQWTLEAISRGQMDRGVKPTTLFI